MFRLSPFDRWKSLFYNAAVLTSIERLNDHSLRWIWFILLIPILMVSCDLLRQTELTITWTTESELDIIGFNLFRAESQDGPYDKINEELIPPASDPNVGGEHTFVDEDVVDGVTYYYKLETLDRQGNSTLTDPIAITAGG